MTPSQAFPGRARFVANGLGAAGAAVFSFLGWEAMTGNPWGVLGFILGLAGLMAYVGLRTRDPHYRITYAVSALGLAFFLLLPMMLPVEPRSTLLAGFLTIQATLELQAQRRKNKAPGP